MTQILNPMRRAALDEKHLHGMAASGDLPPRRLGALRHARALVRGVGILSFTLVACPIQACLVALAGNGRVAFARFYWNMVARLLGLRVRTIGTPMSGRAGQGRTDPGRTGQGRTGQGRTGQGRAERARPVIYVCNHSSWLDIPALGGQLRACFVSKDDVAGWPLVGMIARLGRSVFVSRSRQSIGRERDLMQGRLIGGDDLILFPEGTSSDGSRVLPFHSSFFAAAYGEASPLIQPVSVVYDRLAGLPVGRSSRSVFAWYGDMNLAPHVWQVAQWRGKRVSLLFHTPLDPADFASRKALSQAAWQAVADGAAALRQNRPAVPLPGVEVARPGGVVFA